MFLQIGTAIITGHNGYYKRVQRTASCVSSGVISETSTLYLYLSHEICSAMKYALPCVALWLYVVSYLGFIGRGGGEPEKTPHTSQVPPPNISCQ